MANQFTDYLGRVDLISDAENIKKLLAIPFANQPISMIVHRIGKTLLIDDFDISSYFIREESQQWSWLKRYLCQHVLISNREPKSIMAKKTATRDNLQSLAMLNKFLYHSVLDTETSTREEASADSASANGLEVDLELEPSDSRDVTRWLASKASSELCPNDALANLDLSRDFFERQLDQIDDHYGSYSGSNFSSKRAEAREVAGEEAEGQEEAEEGEGGDGCSSSSYLRNLLWKFEDINMLVGSDMPIFGDSNHPAVSLRLRDMSRPINVLTGLDYWLDNLMCSVPEVEMCYHLDGIVQKYELIKTDDIPQMSNPQFSPSVVRNIAQNILTFLKSKATKSGHTYWLFKGKHDDVVKLYDLSSLMDSENYDDPDDSNPYIIPVAMLLYRVANNVKKSKLVGPEVAQNTVYRLLSKCLAILKKDSTKFRRLDQMAVNCHFLVADILIPSVLTDLNEPEVERASEKETSSQPEFPFDDSSFDFDDDADNSDDECISVLNIDQLRDFPQNSSKKRFKEQERKLSKFPLRSKVWTVRADEAVDHVLNGLEKLALRADSSNDSMSSKAKGKNARQTERSEGRREPESQSDARGKEEEQKMAKSFEAIPMDYKPLKSNLKEEKKRKKKSSSITVNSKAQRESSIVLPVPEVKLSWKECQLVAFLSKASQIFVLLGQKALSDGHLEICRRFSKLGFLSVHCCTTITTQHSNSSLSSEPLTDKWTAMLLALAGDLNLNSGSSLNGSEREGQQEQHLVTAYEKLEHIERRLSKVMDDLNIELESNQFFWALGPQFVSDKLNEQRLKHALRCFEEAKLVLKNNKCPEMILKLGNTANELGCLYMNQSVAVFSEAHTVDSSLYQQLEVLTKSSLSCLVKAIQAFDLVDDAVNCGLLYSNTGKLMRVCAHIFAPVDSNKQRCKEVSAKEKHFYLKSVHYYELAYQRLAQAKKMAASGAQPGLADFAPLAEYAYEAVEKDIVTFMKRAQDLCEKFIQDKTGPKVQGEDHRLVLYRYRLASIRQRLGSLYHHGFRNMADGDARRRQVFTVADDHYSAAQDIYGSLVTADKELLESILERVGLHEHLLNSLTGFSSRLKALETVLRIMEMAKCSVDENSELDGLEMAKMAKLLMQRLVVCILNIVKNLNSKRSKYKQSIETFGQLEADITATLVSCDRTALDISNAASTSEGHLSAQQQTQNVQTSRLELFKVLYSKFTSCCNKCITTIRIVMSEKC
ncbi:Erythroid differentiation-related factor 1 [Halotydeus destructor]|nr:Erythroid differentiation-related factor 1 [Halotydeus destructor]